MKAAAAPAAAAAAPKKRAAKRWHKNGAAAEEEQAAPTPIGGSLRLNESMMTLMSSETKSFCQTFASMYLSCMAHMLFTARYAIESLILQDNLRAFALTDVNKESSAAKYIEYIKEFSMPYIITGDESRVHDCPKGCPVDIVSQPVVKSLITNGEVVFPMLRNKSNNRCLSCANHTYAYLSILDLNAHPTIRKTAFDAVFDLLIRGADQGENGLPPVYTGAVSPTQAILAIGSWVSLPKAETEDEEDVRDGGNSEDVKDDVEGDPFGQYYCSMSHMFGTLCTDDMRSAMKPDINFKTMSKKRVALSLAKRAQLIEQIREKQGTDINDRVFRLFRKDAPAVVRNAVAVCNTCARKQYVSETKQCACSTSRAYYCDVECQRRDWPEHRNTCMYAMMKRLGMSFPIPLSVESRKIICAAVVAKVVAENADLAAKVEKEGGRELPHADMLVLMQLTEAERSRAKAERARAKAAASNAGNEGEDIE